MSTPTTPRGRRARQGYRMALVGAILLPLALGVASMLALGAGFCSDWGDEQTCADQQRSSATFGVVMFLVPVALVVWGTVRSHRNRPQVTERPRRDPPPSRPLNHKAVVALVLAVGGWSLTLVGTGTGGSLLLWLAVATWCPFPSLVLAWRARAEIRESSGRQRGRGIAWGATAVTCTLLLLALVHL